MRMSPRVAISNGGVLHRCWYLLTCLLFVVSTLMPCCAATPPETTTGVPTGAHMIDLDLSSTVQTGTAAKVFASHNIESVVISAGSTSRQITPSTLLTPAQRLAVFQLVSTGHQSIQLGPQGNAVGGSFTIGAQLAQHINNLVIPQGVTAINKLVTSANLTLAGNLINAGTFYVASTNPAITTAMINAANISNSSGALLSSLLPSGGLPGITGALNKLSLSLNARNEFMNAGAIKSAGDLTVIAGGSIVNALPEGASGSSPVMQALNNVAILSGTGSIVNGGLIAASAGNISVAGQTVTNLTINNVGGVLQAAAGSVDICDARHTELCDVRIGGGVITARSINVFGHEMNVNVEELNAPLNMTGSTAHVTTHNDNLTLGNMSLTGDPLSITIKAR